jgi:uncharacterized protein YqeY
MSLKDHIDADIKKAMLAKQKEELIALRSIKSAILLAETEKGAAPDSLDTGAEMKLLMKAAKQRKESAELYQKEGRQDLAAKEIFEYEVISKYLPEQMSEDDLKSALNKIIEQLGADGPQDMGKVMGVATRQLAGKAAGKMISSIVRQILTST